MDEDIVDGARAGLAAADIHNVKVVLGDGAVGHAPNAPYDRIEATVGAHAVPHAWLDQLAPGGRLLTPLRLRGSVSRSIAFEDHGGAWRSVGSQMNTFMPLRQGIADDPRVLVPLDRDNTVTLVTNGDQKVDPDALSDIFRQPRTEVWTDVTFRGPESAEYLELWLACAMPNGLSRMPAKNEAIEKGLVTAPYPSSTAVFEGGTLTYLTRRPYAKKAPTAPPCTSSASSATAPIVRCSPETSRIRSAPGTVTSGRSTSHSRSNSSTRPRSPRSPAASPSTTC